MVAFKKEMSWKNKTKHGNDKVKESGLNSQDRAHHVFSFPITLPMTCLLTLCGSLQAV